MRYLILGMVVAMVAFDCPAGAKDIDTSLSVATGVDYSSGKYGGTQNTDILVEITSVNLKADDFLFSAALPYLDISGPAYYVVGSNGAPVIINPKAGSSITTRTGLGDLNLSATYTMPTQDLWGIETDLTGLVKVPTADVSKGLGTGKVDFGFSVDISRQFEVFSPFLTLGYRVPESPAAYTLNNTLSLSAGFTLPLGNTLAIISYDYDQSASASLDDSHELFASDSWVFQNRYTFTIYSEVGLSTGAPNIGAGLLVSVKTF